MPTSPSTPPDLDDSPTLPTRNNRSTFVTLSEGWRLWQKTAFPQLVAIATWCYDTAVQVYNNAVEGASSAGTAGTAATTATTQASNAAASAVTAGTHATTAGTHATTAGSHATAAGVQAAAAEVSRDAIDNRVYPGTYGSDPTTRPDGTTRQAGDVCFTSAGVPKVYAAGVWAQIPGASAADLANSSDVTKGSAIVGYFRSPTGHVGRSMASKAADTVHARDFGAVGDGVTDDTASLLAAFTYCIPLGKPLELEGTYLVSGPITYYGDVASGSLHIVCKGNVNINVAGGSTAFTHLLYVASTAANNGSVSGGALRLDLNLLCANGLTFRHYGASESGVVNLESPVTVLNAKENNAAAVNGNYGIAVIGDYSIVKMMSPKVVGVQRTNAVAGDCKGIAVTGFSGEVSLHQPHVENILHSPGTVDADGIAVFGKNPGTTYNRRNGRVVLHQPVFIDCQGRSFKSQCNDVTIIRPRVFRKMIVTQVQGHDFDFQTGNGIVIEPDIEYRLNGATSPLGASFRTFALQQLTDNEKMQCKILGGIIRTEVAMLNVAYSFQQPTAEDAITEFNGLQIITLGALIGSSALTRSFMEFDASQVEAKAKKTRLVVRNTHVPSSVPLIAYTLYGGGALTSKLSWDVSDNTNTLAMTGASKPFYNTSGSAIVAVENFYVRNNRGYGDLMPAGFTFNMATLEPGTSFTIDIATAVVTGAPAWGATGYAFVECLGIALATTGRHLRVTKDQANAANTVFASYASGSSWGTIK